MKTTFPLNSKNRVNTSVQVILAAMCLLVTTTAHPQSEITVSPAVRENLGIRFAQVEERAVRATFRVPGRFELLPSARHDHHTPVSGRVSLKVDQYQSVKAGDTLAVIDSPDWRKLQADLIEAIAAERTAQSSVVVAEAARQEQSLAIALLQERIDRLTDANVRRVELDTELSRAKLVSPRLEAELAAAQVQAQQASAHIQALMLLASATTGVPPKVLSTADSAQQPIWQTLANIPIKAKVDGVIVSVATTDGQWVQTGDELMQAIEPRRLRFRAEALISDMQKLKTGLPVRLAPPSGAGITLNNSADATLTLSPTADPEDRTLPLYATPQDAPAWAIPGVAGFMEITLNPEAPTEFAIPRSAVVQDGTELIFFRRNPQSPNEVIRTIADTGTTDGRWIELFSGVRKGDEVVVEGVYQLLAASSSTLEEGGHFHADGTFHEGEH